MLEGFSGPRVLKTKSQFVTHELFLRSGSAADTQAMTDVVKIQLEWLEIQQGEPSKVHTAAHIFKGLGYEYRDQVSSLTFKFNVELSDVLTSISHS